jgi:translation initiation factor IF-2
MGRRGGALASWDGARGAAEWDAGAGMGWESRLWAAGAAPRGWKRRRRRRRRPRASPPARRPPPLVAAKPGAAPARPAPAPAPPQPPAPTLPRLRWQQSLRRGAAAPAPAPRSCCARAPPSLTTREALAPAVRRRGRVKEVRPHPARVSAPRGNISGGWRLAGRAAARPRPVTVGQAGLRPAPNAPPCRAARARQPPPPRRPRRLPQAPTRSGCPPGPPELAACPRSGSEGRHARAAAAHGGRAPAAAEGAPRPRPEDGERVAAVHQERFTGD